MSGNRPRVSIVIPTYDHAHFLGEAIESALGQDVSPIEVIVVDDGSHDDPGAVVARFPGVRVIGQANAGLAAARNTGWRAASGPYVVFLDADDRLLPGALSANLDSFSAHPGCGFVYGTYRIIRVDGSLRKEGKFTEIAAEPFETFLRGNVIRMHATVMYRREALEEVGGFDPAMRACEDYELYLRLSRLHPVASHPTCVAEYRQHEGNMSRQFSFMLRWALVALRRQKVEAGRTPSLRAAYKEGLRNWKRMYLHKQVEALRQARTAAALGEFIKVALAAPDQFVSLSVGVVLRPLGRERL